MPYSCWVLDEADRERLLLIFPPIFPDVLAHHVTYKFNSRELPPEARITICSQVVDPTGVQALVVRVEMHGSPATSQREDGNVFHITWSIDRLAGKKPVSSVAAINDLWISEHHIALASTPVETTPQIC